MFGGGGSGFFQQSKSKSKSKEKFWTGEQQKVAKGLGNYYQQWIDPETGTLTGVNPYEGKLAGTYEPGAMSNLFKQATAYSEGDYEGSPLFRHYAQYSDPEQRAQMVEDRVGVRQRILDPQQEKQDSLMRAKMKSMGLQHSTDMLKTQADIEGVRQAETEAYAMDLMDRYEQLGFEASEAAMQTLSNVASMDYEITNRGLEAEFNEWLRMQPENNPIIEQMMAYLGLQGIAESKGKVGTTEWGVSGSASYMSDEKTKCNVVDLTPIAFNYKEEYGGGHPQIGIMAQEVEKLYPHLVEVVDGVKVVNYATLSAILLLALKARS